MTYGGSLPKAALEWLIEQVKSGRWSMPSYGWSTGKPLGVAERRLTGNGPVWGVRPALLAPVVAPPAGHGSFPSAAGDLGAA
jgi:hypothetical protein